MTIATMKPMWAVADWLGRSRHTVRQWYRDGLLVHTDRDPTTGDLLVDMFEVQALSDVRPTRTPRRKQPDS